MSRSARFVWTKAIEGIEGLPQCPPDLTEPQYSSLLFEQLCCVMGFALYKVLQLIRDFRQACESVRASKVYVSLRLRFCSACSTAKCSGFPLRMSPSNTPVSILSLKRGRNIHPYPSWPFAQNIFLFIPSCVATSASSDFRSPLAMN